MLLINLIFECMNKQIKESSVVSVYIFENVFSPILKVSHNPKKSENFLQKKVRR